MKKRFLSILLLVPPMLLASCKGPKIGDEKAKEIANKITENTNALDDASFEISLKAKGAEGKGEDKKIQDITYTLSQDKEENMKLKVKGQDGDKNYDFVIYTVKHATYDTVAYIKEYDVETKIYKEQVIAKSLDENYSTKTSPYTMQALAPAIIIGGLADPVKLMESDDFKQGEIEDDGLTYKIDINYHSFGEKNLTIDATRKYVKGTIPEGEEVNIEYNYLITYDNLVIKKAVINGKSNFGNTTDIKADIDFKKFKIELPSNWESLLNQ